MPFRAGKLLLTVHVATSVGFFGAVVVFFGLALTGLFASDPETVEAAYIAGALVTWLVIVPLALATLATGIVQSLGTSWGLMRHYWVLVKLLLTIALTAVLLVHTQPIDSMAALAAKSDLSGGAFFARRLQLVVAAGGGLLLLLAATWLSMAKPRGLTRYGWRKEQARRPAFAP